MDINGLTGYTVTFNRTPHTLTETVWVRFYASAEQAQSDAAAVVRDVYPKAANIRISARVAQ